MKSSFERTNLTAYGVAELRSYSDIPFSAEILEFIKNSTKPDDQLKYPTERAPQLEARYKLIDRLIVEAKIEQILELASGLSPRGLSMSQKDHKVDYVEMDLPDMIDVKKTLITKLLNGKNFPSNLRLIKGNALNIKDIEEAMQFLEPKPMIIAHEGLLRYLNFSEKKIVARNVRDILKRYGGIWITSDITLRSVLEIESKQAPDQIQTINKMIGRTVSDNAFESIDDAQKFFESFGFIVEKHSFTETIGDLVSPKKLNLSVDKVKNILGEAVVFVMRIEGE